MELPNDFVKQLYPKNCQSAEVCSVVSKLQDENKWLSKYAEDAEGCNWREIMKQALKDSNE